MLTFYPSRIPDPGVKKAPDPGSGSATLLFAVELVVYFVIIVQETKAQFARDDPAFLVLLAAWLVISSVRSYQTQSSRDCFKY
jgi:hypothetical protein